MRTMRTTPTRLTGALHFPSLTAFRAPVAPLVASSSLLAATTATTITTITIVTSGAADACWKAATWQLASSLRLRGADQQQRTHRCEMRSIRTRPASHGLSPAKQPLRTRGRGAPLH
jgi:hypothetical protein